MPELLNRPASANYAVWQGGAKKTMEEFRSSNRPRWRLELGAGQSCVFVGDPRGGNNGAERVPNFHGGARRSVTGHDLPPALLPRPGMVDSVSCGRPLRRIQCPISHQETSTL